MPLFIVAGTVAASGQGSDIVVWIAFVLFGVATIVVPAGIFFLILRHLLRSSTQAGNHRSRMTTTTYGSAGGWGLGGGDGGGGDYGGGGGFGGGGGDCGGGGSSGGGGG